MSLLPVVLIMNVLVLLSGLADLLDNWGGYSISFVHGDEVNRLYNFLLPAFFNLSLSSLLAREKDLDLVGTQLIALLCFFRLSHFLVLDGGYGPIFHESSLLISLACTWLSVRLFHYLSGVNFIRLIRSANNVPPNLKSTFDLLIPGLLTVLCFELVGHYLPLISTADILKHITAVVPRPADMNEVLEVVVYKLVALCTWSIGLHGEHSAQSVFQLLNQAPYNGPKRTDLDNLHNVFMNIGGSGATFVLPLMILRSKRLKPFKVIARFSLIFSFFNVNELLLFGLPVILNPLLLIPFLLAPFINLGIVLCMLALGTFSITTEYVPWMSMPLYSAYVASDGSLWAVATQIGCILADGLVYFPFLLLVSRQHKASSKLKQLLSSEQYGFLEHEMQNQKSRQFTTQQREQQQQLALAQQLLDRLKKGRLQLYYQPKFDAQSLDVVGFEALLRLQDRTGNVSSPSFLPILYAQGLSKTIDSKVIELVFEHASYWRDLRISVPTIAINFDKDFLLDSQAVRGFLQQARFHNMSFDIEITEHTYTAEIEALVAVVARLQSAGHRVSIDDFGAGYSSLTILAELAVHEIKLDRQFIVSASENNQRGAILLEACTKICHDLGFVVLAEGIETRQQLKMAQRAEVDVLQGYYLGRPMSHHQIVDFIRDPWYQMAQTR